MKIEYAEGAERANIGCRPLGRGPIASPIVLEEIRKHKLFVKDMAALPPSNSNENALLHRQCMVKHYPNLIDCFRQLGLSF